MLDVAEREILSSGRFVTLCGRSIAGAAGHDGREAVLVGAQHDFAAFQPPRCGQILPVQQQQIASARFAAEDAGCWET